MVALSAYTMALLVGLLSYRLMVSRQRILALAVHDRLTGLPNRRLFEDRLSQAVSAALRHRRIAALLLLDLDRFKPVNDTFGHRSGDQVLMRAAQRLGSLVRGSDSVSRLGGDEFAIILHEIGSPEEALRFGERAVEAFREPFLLEKGATAEVGLSVGIAVFPPQQEVETLNALFDRADRALYQSKKRGGSSFTLDRPVTTDQPAVSAALPASNNMQSGE
ncbi:MAG: GGDEF domain-containing protein [Betaproteobacteria bacterium]